MTLTKRSLTKGETKQLVEAMWTNFEPWERDGEKQEVENFVLQDNYTTCIADSETGEPLFIVLEAHEDMADAGTVTHEAVFEWRDGKLLSFEHIER